MWQTLEHLSDGQTVLCRLDLNSPVEDGIVRDNKRFRRHAATVSTLVEGGHRVVLLAHQGRPDRDDFLSLEQHAAIFESHLDTAVQFVPETVGDRALSAIDALEAGEVLLLENVRFLEDELANRSPEEHARSEFVQTLAGVTDVFVNDAYSVAHRSHASIVGFPLAMDSYAGTVMVDEYTFNSSIQRKSFDGDVVMVMGGTKAEDLIDVMDAVSEKVDTFLVGGVIGELFLRAEGHGVGYDVEETDIFDGIWAQAEDELETLIEHFDDRLILPVDLAYTDDEGQRAERPVGGGPKERAFYDIGTETIDRFVEMIEDAEAVFVKGAVGVYEDDRFEDGTRAVLEAIAKSSAYSVVGGGDTAEAIDKFGLSEDAFSHVSIAGGAYVMALAGQDLPGIQAMDPARKIEITPE